MFGVTFFLKSVCLSILDTNECDSESFKPRVRLLQTPISMIDIKLSFITSKNNIIVIAMKYA